MVHLQRHRRAVEIDRVEIEEARMVDQWLGPGPDRLCSRYWSLVF